MNITRLETTYTGGGIYIYTGAIDTGAFFLASDDCNECVHILDEDPYANFDDCLYADWLDAHTVAILTGEDAFAFWHDMLSCDLGDMLDTDRTVRLEWLNK